MSGTGPAPVVTESVIFRAERLSAHGAREILRLRDLHAWVDAAMAAGLTGNELVGTISSTGESGSLRGLEVEMPK